MERNVFGILDNLANSVTALRNALAPLSSLAGGSSRSATAGTPRSRRKRGRKTQASGVRRKASAAPKASRKPVSAAVKAKRVLQGRYLGAIRPLSKANRARVKGVQAKQGHQAAIKLAKSLKK